MNIIKLIYYKSYKINVLYVLLTFLLLINGYIFQKCPHCNNESKSLGRHLWRCKAKLSNTPVVIQNFHGNELQQ